LTRCFIDLRTVALGLQDVSNPDAPQRLTRKHRRPARRLGRGEPAGSSQIVFIWFFEPFKHLR
jgi:hypothetical protein